MSLTFVFVTIFAWIKLISSRPFFQTAHLKPSSAFTVAGIAVNAGPGATVVDDQWFINVVSQQGSDLSIVLDSRWGFHDSFVSSVELYIEGITTNETYDTDGEMLFVFNVDDEYFAEMISLDARKSSYKECPSSGDRLITRDVTQMITSSLPDRYHRFCKNAINTPNDAATDNWNNAGTQSLSYKQPAQWPMTIRVTNNPLTNTVSYSWTDAINGFVSSEFSSSFTPNRGINIFISGESPNEDFFIYSVDITYRYEAITSEPTTSQPTDKPTLKPTTSLPTVSPTDKPSISPTPKPTDAPTTAPSWSPTTFEVVANKSTFVRTAIVNVNPTKILFVKVANDGDVTDISWFQAMVIIVAMFVFIVIAFAFCVNRKPKPKKVEKPNDRKHSVSISNQGEDECESEVVIHAKDYQSESTMIAIQKEEKEPIADFLDINMVLQSSKLYQQQYTLHHPVHQAQYNIPATPSQQSRECEAESQPMTPNHKANSQYLDYSETDMGHSETEELSRHDMIYIPGKQTKYREKYRASIMRQQSTMQLQQKGYKVSVQSLDI